MWSEGITIKEKITIEVSVMFLLCIEKLPLNRDICDSR